MGGVPAAQGIGQVDVNPDTDTDTGNGHVSTTLDFCLQPEWISVWFILKYIRSLPKTLFGGSIRPQGLSYDLLNNF